MKLWRQLVYGLRALVRRGVDDREISDEVRHWLEEAEAELIARGRTPEQARRELRLAYGDAVTMREEVRSYGWENVVEALVGDVRYALRRLRRTPGFTTVAVLTLGVGIGAATAIYSVVDSVLFEPLAYPDPERVVSIAEPAATPGGSPMQLAFGTFREIGMRSRAFDALAVLRPWQPTYTGSGEPARLDGLRVSGEYFRVLGVQPAIGAGFDVEDDRPGGPRVVVLSDGLWRRRFGADRGIVGGSVRLDGQPHTVVGVMPAGFQNVPGRAAELWTLLQYDASLPSFDGREWGRHLDMIGRVARSADLEAARRELDLIAGEPLPEVVRPAWASLEGGLAARPLREAATAGPRPALLAMLGAAALLLGITCVNVTNLLLARGARRRGELAVRAALGAGRGRIGRQLVAESLVLAGLGGLLAILVARIGVDALVALAPPGLPRLESVGFDARAFAFALGVTTLIGVVVGLVPAAGRGPNRDTMAEAGRGASRRHYAARRALVVAEVALALMLLVGAGLVQRSLRELFAVSPGFDPANVVVMQVQAGGARFADDASVHRFFAEALEVVRALPGVDRAAWTSQLPLSGEGDRYGVTPEEAAGPEDAFGAYRYAVSPGYFAAMGIPLLRGRLLGERDVAGAPGAVVVNESFVNRYAAGGDPLGMRVHVGRTDLPWATVVGVVGDVKQASLEAGSADAVYLTPEQWYFADPVRWLVVRADRDAAGLVPELERAVWSVDPNQPIVRVTTMRDLVAASEAQRRFALVILQAFAVIAVVLAAIGLYGVVAGSVGDRVREIGVRSALGASSDRIRSMVVRQGMALASVGILVGLVGAAIGSSVLSTLLFGVSRLDPATYAAVVAALAAVAAFACWIPAARAARIDPASTLRTE